MVGVFAVFIFSIISKGLDGFNFNFLILTPQSAGRAGGISSILISSVLVLAVCMFFTIPIGIGAGYYLAEIARPQNKSRKIIKWSLYILASSPSIVFGLFGNAFFSTYLKLGFSILAGGLTLTCMCLPFFIFSVETAMSSVSAEVKDSATALNLSKTTTLFKILLPSSLPFIISGLLLSIARAVSETAALIFTSGSVDRMPESLFDSGRVLSVHIYELSMNVTGGDQNAYKSAFVLICFVIVINLITSNVAKVIFKQKVSL